MSKKPLNIYNTFDKVESILLGSVDKSLIKLRDPKHHERLQDIFDETENDLNVIQRVLEKRGITVYRPTPSRNSGIVTPYFESPALDMPLTPRDTTLVLGNTLIETASWKTERLFGTYDYREIFLELQSNGAKWMSMPLPRHNYRADNTEVDVINQDPIIDGAAVLRVGKDVFVSNGGSHNQLGLDWLKTNFPEYRYHLTDKNFYGHMDAHICVIRPGLLYTNHDRNSLPNQFKNWQVIRTPYDFDRTKISEDDLIDDLIQDDDRTNTVLSTNCLVLDQNTVMMPNHYQGQKQVLDQFDKHQIEILFVPLNYQYFFGQGLTCMTQELYRDTDGLHDYF